MNTNTVKDGITLKVIEDLKSRAILGQNKYSTTLEENTKDNFLQHAYEEALDLAQYLKKRIEFDRIKYLVEKHPNNFDLGEAIRKLYM